MAEFGTDEVYKVWSSKWFCLGTASRQDQIDLVNLFIGKGVDIDQRGSDYRTALHYAASGSRASLVHVDIAKVLLDAGADIEPPTWHHLWTPLHYAARDMIRPEIISLLIQRGANIDERSNVGATPLRVAIFNENAVVTEELLTLGASMAKAKDSTYKQSEFDEGMKADSILNAVARGKVVNT